MIPDSVQEDLQNTLGETIRSVQAESGGSINRAARIVLEDTGPCFLKWNASVAPDMFEKELRGLEMLDGAGTQLVVPGAIARGPDYLLLEYIPRGHSKPGSDESFGRELARLHKKQNGQFGLDYDNYIGRLPQSNRRHGTWTDFFISERMNPQLKMAVDAGKLGREITGTFESMYRQLDGIFPDEPPSLLHGDLWGGNYFYDEGGKAVIYDPAVYYGNREIEIAFTHLFGGFSGSFYAAYNESFPLQDHFTGRKDIYNLYPLLVHTNLFGGSYARQVENIVSRFN